MMKAKNLIFLALIAISISSCYQGDEFYPDNYTEEGYDDEGQDHQGHDHGAEAEEGSLTLYKVQGEDIAKIEDFEVSGNLENYQQDYGKHIKMWEFIKKLVPASERERIGEFMVFYGADDLAGYVEPINQNDLSKWRFGLAIEIADNLEEIDFKDFFTYVTIHELGHVVTLNESQVEVNISENECSNFFPGEGCAKANSYINKLFDLGWMDIYNGNEEDLYKDYPERFVSEYAGTNPGEDIAEVFAFFITEENRRSGSSIADKKVNLLYEFPELVELREEMRGVPSVRALQAGDWLTNPVANKFRIRHRHSNHQAAFN